MTAVNWLSPPVSLTPDLPCMQSNLNCAVIAYVAFLSTLFLQWNLISLRLPLVEFSATRRCRGNTKHCVNKERQAEGLFFRGGGSQNVTVHWFASHPLFK